MVFMPLTGAGLESSSEDRIYTEQIEKQEQTNRELEEELAMMDMLMAKIAVN